MSQGIGQQATNDIGNDLLKAITICEERIRISKANQIKHIEITKQINSTEQLIDITRETTNHMVKVYKNVKYFLENKKNSSKDILEASVRSVSAIVKDSDLQGCIIEHENGKTRILNEKRQNINSREGSAARATMGLLLRYTCLKAMPNKIQIMFLDEALATLSSTTSVNLREMLEVFSENIGIVGIEQKDILYNGLAQKKYLATKIDGVSTIREQDVI